MIEIRNYIDEINNLNKKALDDMLSDEGYSEEKYAKEKELMNDKFNKLVEKYGLDAVLCEMGLA